MHLILSAVIAQAKHWLTCILSLVQEHLYKTSVASGCITMGQNIGCLHCIICEALTSGLPAPAGQVNSIPRPTIIANCCQAHPLINSNG